MLSVQISINLTNIITLHAVNVSSKRGKTYGEGTQIYEVFLEDNKKPVFEIKHKFSDGAEILSAKVLLKHHKMKFKENYYQNFG